MKGTKPGGIWGALVFLLLWISFFLYVLDKQQFMFLSI